MVRIDKGQPVNNNIKEAPTPPDGEVCVSEAKADVFVPQEGLPTSELGNVINGKITYADINNTQLTILPAERLELYRHSPPHLRTAHTDRLLKIGDLWKYFKSLKPEDFKKRSQKIREAASELKELTFDVIDLYTEGRLLPIFGVSRLTNEAYRGRDATAIRFDFDIGTLNRLVDPTGSLADEFIPAIGDWFNDKIVSDRQAFYLFGEQPLTVIRLPERTSFVVIGPNSEEGKELVNFVTSELKYFTWDMQNRLLEAQKKGRIAPDVDISAFEPTATAHYTTIHLKGFMEEYRSNHNLSPIRKIPRYKVVNHVLDELRRLAGETTYLKAYPPAEPAIVVGGFFVYGDEALPKESEPMYQSLTEFIGGGRGFIPFGRFGFQDEKDPETRFIHEYRDIPHHLGDIYSQSRGGRKGALEYFLQMVDSLTLHPALARTPKLDLFRKTTDSLVMLVLNIGEEARRDSKFPSPVKSIRTWSKEPADFFLEQVGSLEYLSLEGLKGVKYDILATVEVDDGRSFTTQHPIVSLIDEDFQRIKWLIFDIEKEMELYPPVVAAEGDQIRVAVPSVTKNGVKLMPEDILKYYQQRVHRWFADKQFQPYAKVVGEDGELVRLPIWVDKESGELKVADRQPKKYVPWEKALTVTISYTEMPDLSKLGSASEASGAEKANRKIHLMFKYIDKNLKAQNGPFVKEGFGRLPEDFENGSWMPDPLKSKFSMLSDFDLDWLFKAETIPIRDDVNLEPLSTPMPELPGMLDGLIVSMPVKVPSRFRWGSGGVIIAPEPVRDTQVPQPMITPADPPGVPHTLASGAALAQEDIVAGFLGDTLAATSYKAFSSVTLPRFNLPRIPAAGYASGGLNTFCASFIVMIAGLKGYINDLPPSYYTPPEKAGNFLMKADERIENMMDGIDGYFRQRNCISNPTRACFEKFGSGIMTL